MEVHHGQSRTAPSHMQLATASRRLQSPTCITDTASFWLNIPLQIRRHCCYPDFARILSTNSELSGIRGSQLNLGMPHNIFCRLYEICPHLLTCSPQVG
jgi:hypothetical protein